MSRREADIERQQEITPVLNSFCDINITLGRCLDGNFRLKSTDADRCDVLSRLLKLDLESRYPMRRHHVEPTGRGRESGKRAETLFRFMRAHNLDLRNVMNQCSSFQAWKPFEGANSDMKLKLLNEQLISVAAVIRQRAPATALDGKARLSLRILEEFCQSVAEMLA